MPRARVLDLSPQETAVATAYALEGLPLAEVAALHGMTEGTVRSYLKRARAKYRQRGVDAGTQHRLRLALLADRPGE